MKQDKITLLILLLFCVQILNAQIGTGGKPYSFQKSYLQLTKVPIELMPHKDNAILLEQEQPASKEDGYIFGEIINVKYTPNNSGLWEDLSNGDRLWRLAIKSKGAYSLNLVFDKFYMPIHSYMYIYTADKSYVTGAFTTNNNNENRSFATDIYPSDEIVIEYYESKYDRDSTFIELSKIVHAYKDIFPEETEFGNVYKWNDYWFDIRNVVIKAINNYYKEALLKKQTRIMKNLSDITGIRIDRLYSLKLGTARVTNDDYKRLKEHNII